MLVVVTPTADRVPGHPEDCQKDPNDDQDDPQRQEDRNGGDQPDDQQNNAENDHEPHLSGRIGPRQSMELQLRFGFLARLGMKRIPEP